MAVSSSKQFYQNMTKNKQSVKQICDFNFEHFIGLFHENIKIVTHLLSVNEEAVNNYFKKLDL